MWCSSSTYTRSLSFRKNRHGNDNLEQQVQALFKAWFVDFEPFKDGEFVDSELGMIPKGWKVENLTNCFDFLEGPGIRNWQYVEKKGTKFINIRCIQNNDLNLTTANMISTEEAYGKYNHFLLKESDLIMSTSGTLGRFAIVRKEHLPLCLNTSVIRFRPLKECDYSFMVGYLTSCIFKELLETMACGSVQANFGPTHLKQIKLIYPDETVLQHFNQVMYPIIQMSNGYMQETLKLTQQRDTLLPKLMSGELKISDLNC